MADNPYSRFAAPQNRQAVVIADPYRARDERRKDEDLANEAERLRLAQEAAARDAAAALRATQTQEAELYAKGLRVGSNGEIERIPGWTPLPTAESAAAEGKEGSRETKLRTLIEQIDRVDQLYRANLQGGFPNAISGRVPGFIRQENEQFDAAAAGLAEQGLSAFRVPGVGSQSDAELRQFVQANRPLPTDSDLAIEEKLRTLRMRAQAEIDALTSTSAAGPLRGGAQSSGSAPPAAPVLPSALTMNRILPGASDAGAAKFGATTGTVGIPPEMQAEYEAGLAGTMRNGRFDPDAYATLRSQLDRKYGFPDSSADGYRAWATEANRKLDQGGATISSTIPAPERDLSNVEWLRNSAVNNPVGSFATSMGNAGSFGILSLVAPDQFGALREARPVSSMLGEVAGSVTGTMGVGAGLNALAGKVTNQTIAKLLANPLTTDMAYGATYGATQADDPLLGAVTGAGSALVGNRAGNWLGKSAPILTGVRRPEDALLPSERAVYDAANRSGTDEVARLLAQGQNLGVPMSLADASPDVNSLTGAALRRSPAAAGAARDALATRSRGQYDRLLGAIERDLGPIENVPQRSEDLIAQARSQARPLYERAYAAPGASSVKIDDLMSRPTFAEALAEAAREAADEGVDPRSLGFDFNEAGDMVLGSTPSWQTLDYAKRGLDNIIERETSKIDGVTPAGRRAVAMKNELLSRMDAINPDYAAARAAYAGPASERAMLARGQEALRMSPNQLGVNVGNASPAQVEQMRLGFQSGLAEQAGRLRNSTNAFNILDNPAMEQRIAALGYQDDEIARLLSQRDLERNVAASSNRLVGNSMTAERNMADQAFGENGLVGDLAQGTVETLLTGAPVVTAARSGIGRGLGQAYRDWRSLGVGRRATELADGIAPIALDMGKGEQILADLATRNDAWQKEIVEALLKSGRRGAHTGGAAAAVIAAELTR